MFRSNIFVWQALSRVCERALEDASAFRPGPSPFARRCRQTPPPQAGLSRLQGKNNRPELFSAPRSRRAGRTLSSRATPGAIRRPSRLDLRVAALSASLLACSCSIPDDHLSPRRAALFMARSVLREVRNRGATILIHLHSQATTTPKVRAAIQASTETAPVLAERFGVTEQTVYKWRHRDSVEDLSHTPHRLQTTLRPRRRRWGGIASGAACLAR